MLRLALVCVALVGAVSCASLGEQESVGIEVVSDINDYLRKNPTANLVELQGTRLGSLQRDLQSDGILYTVGRRKTGIIIKN